MKQPFLSKDAIAGSADALLARYAALRGAAPAPPIPVEDIIERGLGLELGFLDFEGICGLPGVLGALYVTQRRICIDERLAGGGIEGRYCFTCAHEAGHWVLHRGLVEGRGPCRGAILCRAGGRSPIEWQADYFAACLLMPANLVREVFFDAFGVDALHLVNVRSAYAGPACFDPCADNWPRIAERMRQWGSFSNVSKQAMIIRLQDLGLVVNASSAGLGWTPRRSA